MTAHLPSLPEAIPTLAAAEAFSDLYLNQVPGLRQQLAKLELQAVFLLLVDTLEDPSHDYDQLRLTADGDSVWIELAKSQALDDNLLIVNEDEEIGARAKAFMDQLPYFNEDHAFVDYLDNHPLTRENKWTMAAALFGKEAASALEAAGLEQHTPIVAAGPASRPRM